MKEDVKVLVDREQSTMNEAEMPAHLSFRRIVIHDFVADEEPQTVRFYYRSHRQHVTSPRAAA